MTMKRIAFIDHDIANWHANTFARLLAESNRGYKLAAICASRTDNSQEWAARHGVPSVASVTDLAGLADCLMVLAPSNPESHPGLCAEAFRLGLPTYVDKTFAPDPATADEIFRLADAAGVPVQSSSVLRYTEIQEFCSAEHGNRPQFVDIWGGGTNFHEYIIHQVEMAVSLMGPEFLSLETTKLAHITRIDLTFSGGRAASLHVASPAEISFSATVSNPQVTKSFVVDEGRLFVSGLNGILDFFDAGRPLVDRRETLAIMQVLHEVRNQASSQKFQAQNRRETA